MIVLSSIIDLFLMVPPWLRLCWLNWNEAAESGRKLLFFGGQELNKNWPLLYGLWETVIFVFFSTYSVNEAKEGSTTYGLSALRSTTYSLQTGCLDFTDKMFTFFLSLLTHSSNSLIKEWSWVIVISRGLVDIETTVKAESFFGKLICFFSAPVKRSCWQLLEPEYQTGISGVYWEINCWQHCSTQA